jgi:hypothetical protein
MRRSVLCALIFLLFGVGAFADDQEKAEKQIRMMTAMSRDDTARSIISRTFADVFKIQRQQLVAERKSLGLNYGGLFLAHELLQSGARMEQITNELHSRKSMLEITRASHADWKHINDAIYKHFLHSKQDEERDRLEHYNSSADLIGADADATPEELLKAQTQYIFWRNLASPKLAGQADPSNPVAHTYTTQRDETTASHGTVYPGAPQQ